MSILKRTITTLISILFIAVAPVTAMAETYFSDGEFEFIKTNNGNGLITRCELTDEDITIPEFVLGYPIAGIGDYAFMSMPTIKSVSMPLSVVSIGEYAFAENSQEFRVQIPRYCDQIADTAFVNSPNVIIVCKEQSYAKTFAENNGIRFEIAGAQPVQPQGVSGDANGDGVVNIVDVTYIQKYNVGLIEELSDIARLLSDVNHDGSVTIRDATLIQMYIAGIIAEL